MNIQSKVRGCFLGVAIGDALGKPVESWSYEKIKEKFGLIDSYKDCKNNRYFSDCPKGTTTDDWQLTKAIIKSINKEGKIDLDDIAVQHIEEYKNTVAGWGKSTRESIAKIIEGVHWSKAADRDNENRGLGNGIAMKIAPVGVYLALQKIVGSKNVDEKSNIVDICKMTHYSTIALESAFSQVFACEYCFSENPKNFDKDKFLSLIKEAVNISEGILPKSKDSMINRFKLLNFNFETKEIIDNFGEGSCYVYDSLPFSYSFFLKNPNNIESLYNCVSAGGDTDTNGAIVGSLLGALNGEDIFPDHLIQGLENRKEVFELADQFYKKISNEKV